MNTDFLQHIKSLVAIPPEHEKPLCEMVSTKEIKKGLDFISEGEFPKTIGYVRSGLFRYYYIDRNGEEFTKSFFPENTVISSYSAMVENRGSYFTIQALEDSVIETANYYQMHSAFSKYVWWKDFSLYQVQKGFIIKEIREREFLLLDAEQRYEKFKERFPTLEDRVKQHIIASYVGIAPESLSRIRKKMVS